MIKLNNVSAPEWFKVRDFVDVVVPNVSQETIKVPGRKGTVRQRQELDGRTINVDFYIIANNQADLRAKARELAEFLYHEHEVRLEYILEPGWHYKVVLDGSVDLSEVLRRGEGTIVFYAADPVQYANDPIIHDGSEGVLSFDAPGSHSKSMVELTVLNSTASIGLTGNNDYVHLGTTEDEPVKFIERPIILNDSMETVAPWSMASGVKEGVISGSMSSTGYGFVCTDFGPTGENIDWHGPSMVRSLSKSVQDFKAEFHFGFRPNSNEQNGRVEFYVNDVNGVRVARMSLHIGHPTASQPYLTINIGNQTLYAGYGGSPQVWRDATRGLMFIQRRGKQWTFWIGVQGANGTYHSRLQKTYNDTNGSYVHLIGQVQTSLQARQDRPAIQYMAVNHIKVSEWAKPPAGPPATPVYYQPGDVILIDNDTHEVFLNGVPHYSQLDLASTFISLQKGRNIFHYYPVDAEVRIILKGGRL